MQTLCLKPRGGGREVQYTRSDAPDNCKDLLLFPSPSAKNHEEVGDSDTRSFGYRALPMSTVKEGVASSGLTDRTQRVPYHANIAVDKNESPK